MIDNLLFNVENIILPSNIIHFVRLNIQHLQVIYVISLLILTMFDS